MEGFQRTSMDIHLTYDTLRKSVFSFTNDETDREEIYILQI